MIQMGEAQTERAVVERDAASLVVILTSLDPNAENPVAMLLAKSGLHVGQEPYSDWVLGDFDPTANDSKELLSLAGEAGIVQRNALRGLAYFGCRDRARVAVIDDLFEEREAGSAAAHKALLKYCGVERPTYDNLVGRAWHYSALEDTIRSNVAYQLAGVDPANLRDDSR